MISAAYANYPYDICSSYSFLYMPSCSRSSLCVPRSHMRPLCMTMMQSACWIVDRRCATLIVVLPSMSFSSASCMRISVSVSMLAVA